MTVNVAIHNNSRLSLLTAYLADQTDFPPGEVAAQASTLLAALDAEDPLRQPSSDEAVDIALDEWFRNNWRATSRVKDLRIDMHGAIVAALAVMRGESVASSRTTPEPTLYQALAVVLPMLRRYAEDAGDVSAIATVVWAEGVLRDAADPEPAVVSSEVVDANPPPGAIEERIAALEVRPQWTAEKEALLQGLVAEVMAVAPQREFIALSRVFNKAFPRSDRAWPPKDCLLEVLHPEHKSPCVVVCERSDCPHAGEYA